VPHRSKTNRRQFPWPILVFGLLILISAGMLYLIMDRGSGTPSLAVSTDFIDFGDVNLDDSRVFSFTVTNTGNGALKFKEEPFIEVWEGC